jgi:hypothetical protein
VTWDEEVRRVLADLETVSAALRASVAELAAELRQRPDPPDSGQQEAALT